jgi:hypothetical protein
MPDPQVSPAPKKRRKLGLLAVVLVLCRGRGRRRARLGASPLRAGPLLVMLGDQVAPTAPIVCCSTPARFHLRRLLEPFLPKVVVLSPLEIPPMVPVQSLGTVR